MKSTIKVLGSVSPYPKNSLNCPSFLLNHNGNKIMLDCGTGSSSLLNMPEDLDNLNIFISHAHADHYSDIISVQYASYMYKKLNKLNKKINIYLPKAEENVTSKLIEMNKNSYNNIVLYDDKSIIKIGDLNITFFKNTHSIKSYSTKIMTDKFKIVYTGGTGFQNHTELSKFSNNADFLICESTLIKEFGITNFNHMHVYEAANLAKESEVKKLLLFHFWPETDKCKYLEESKQIFTNTHIAVENDVYILKNN